MTECIFCKIVKGEIPSYRVYEDDFVLAFLDINPVSEGHMLVIPKKHVSRFSEFTEEEAMKFSKSLLKVVKMVEEKLSEHYNILSNQGELAGQAIHHLHFHIIPRYGKEEIFVWKTHKLTEEEAKKILSKF